MGDLGELQNQIGAIFADIYRAIPTFNPPRPGMFETGPDAPMPGGPLDVEEGALLWADVIAPQLEAIESLVRDFRERENARLSGRYR